MAESSTEEGDFEKSLEYLSQVQKGDTNYIEASIRKSYTLGELERYDDAIKFCREILKDTITKGLRDFELNLGYMLNKNGQKEEALQQYFDMQERYPFYRTISNNIAYQYLELEQYQNSYEAYKEHVRMYPFDGNGHLNLGIFALNESHFTEAFLALNIVIMLDPYSERAYSALRLLNEVSNNTKIEKEPKEGFQLESDEFKDIDLFIENYTALKKDYKVKAESDLYLTKQNHLIFSLLSDKETSDYFFSSYYVPFYKKLMEEDKFSVMQTFLLLSSENDNHKKLVEKRISDLKDFNSWFRQTWYGFHKNTTLEIDGEERYVEMGFSGTGDIENIVELQDGKYAGKQLFFHPEGRIYAEGNLVNEKRSGEWRYYFESGVLQQILNYKDGELDGEALVYHSNGALSDRLTFKMGERTGPFETFSEAGVLLRKGEYIDGKYNGEITYHFPDGSVEYQTNYSNGLLKGELREYYSDGSLYRTENYTEGISNGTVEILYPDSKLRNKGTTVNGKYNGPYVSYHATGEKESEGQYSNGDFVGEWRKYDSAGQLTGIDTYANSGKRDGISKVFTSEGKLLYEMDYSNGYLVNYKFYDHEGNILSEGGNKKKPFEFLSFHFNGMKNNIGSYQNFVGRVGEWKIHDEYGNLLEVSNYADGELNGEITKYYAAGGIKEKYAYKKGELDGYYTEFYPGGQLKRQGYYVDGKREGTWLTYYIDGTLSGELFYQNSKITGNEFGYAVNGKLDKIVEYKDGILFGATYFDSTGTVLNSFQWPHSIGVYERYHYNGEPGFRGKYILSKSDSVYLWKYENGDIETRGEYANDNKTGTWEWFHRSGNPYQKGSYVNGQQHGKWTDYYENGALEEEYNYIFGDLHGANTSYYESGKREREINYRYGEIHGDYLFFDEDEKLQMGRRYRFGVVEGYFYLNAQGDTVYVDVPDGTAKVEGKFQDGSPSRMFNVVRGEFTGPYKAYNSNGKIAVDYVLELDERHGTYKEFYKNGNIKKELTYLYGELHGPAKEYFENGSIMKSYSYLNDEKHGKEIVYDQSGKVISEIMYYDGYQYESN
jgi:antitoxin component YwqK of YwqJK toxin-antitoxin module